MAGGKPQRALKKAASTQRVGGALRAAHTPALRTRARTRCAMATRGAAARAHLERLLRVGTCLAECDYGAQVGQLAATARAFRADAQLWAAHVRHRGPRGRTHLMHAALIGDAPRLIFLLERGADVKAVDEEGDTALVWACEHDHHGIVRFLVERGGANVNAARTTDGQNALMWACYRGHLETVRFLVERGGANVNAARTTDGFTVLMSACGHCHFDIVRFLLERGGNVNAACTDDGLTALMLASVNGHLEIVRLLLQHGADRHALTHNGLSARDFAAKHPLVLAALT